MAANQLKVLIDSRSFSTSVGEIKLSSFKFKQFSTALEIIEPYVTIYSLDLTPAETAAEIVQQLLCKVEDKYSILVNIAALLQLVSNWNSEQLSELDYDEIIALLVEVVDQNMDFFSRIGERLNKEEDKQKTEPLPSPVATIGESVSAA